MRKIKSFLLIEGIVAMLMAILLFVTKVISHPLYLLSLPFVIIGRGLQALSLNSVAGNICSIFFYILLSLVPIFYLLYRYRQQIVRKADFLLIILSAYLFYMIYHFINPSLMLNHISNALSDVDSLPYIELTFSIIFYTLLIMYYILHLLEGLTEQKLKQKPASYLSSQLQIILFIAAGLYTFFIAYFCTYGLLNEYTTFNNQYPSESVNFMIPKSAFPLDSNLLLNRMYIVLSYFLDIIPLIFLIFILVSGIALLKTFLLNHMQAEEAIAARALGKISKQTVYITIVCNLCQNVFQFIFSKQLQNINFNLQISFTPLIIAFAAYILAGYFKEARHLYEDNNMII